MKIGTLCKQCGVTPRTVRFYEENGFITPVKFDDSAHKFYTKQSVEIIASIRALQEIGYSLEAIKNLLSLSKSKKTREKWLTIRLRHELESQATLLENKISLITVARNRIKETLKKTTGCPSCSSADCAGCPRLTALRTLGGISETE